MKNNSYNETTEKFGHSQNLDVDFVAKCEISNKEGQPDHGFGQRHLQALLCFVGLFVAFGMRSDLSVGVVAMTNSTRNPEFQSYPWNEAERGLILSSLYWGYVISPFFAGFLAKSFGAKMPLLLAMLSVSILTICTKNIAAFGWQWMCVSRFSQGLGQGFCFPCVHTLLAKWVHPTERALISITCSGSILGTAFMLSVSGVIASSTVLGWPGIFYISGGMGIVWSIVWALFCSNTPQDCRSMSNEEREFTETIPSNRGKKLPFPWRKIATSKPFWAILCTQAAENWLFVTLLANIPSYIDGVLEYSLHSNALLSALPYLVMTLMIYVFSFSSEYLIRHKYVTVTMARRLYNTIAMWCPAVCLIVLGSMRNDIYSAVVLLSIGVGLNAGINSGYLMNHVDISPNFAGPIMGVCHGTGNILSIVGPIFTGYLVYDIHDPSLWNIMFLTTAVISFVGGSIFMLWSSGDVQKWNDDSTKIRGP